MKKNKGVGRMNLYDSEGLLAAYSEDGIHIFLSSGEPVAYFEGDSVYSFSGQHLGWRHKGWIMDHDGDGLLFSGQAEEGPEKPLVQEGRKKEGFTPIPEKELRQFEPLRPPMSAKWSRLSVHNFFQSGA